MYKFSLLSDKKNNWPGFFRIDGGKFTLKIYNQD